MSIPWKVMTQSFRNKQVTSTQVQVVQSSEIGNKYDRKSTAITSVTGLTSSFWFKSKLNSFHKPPKAIPAGDDEAEEEDDDDSIIYSRDDFRLFLHPKSFVLFWFLVVFFRACEIAFLVAMVWLYAWLLWNAHRLIDSINDLTFDFGYTTLAVMNWAFAFLALLQTIVLVESLVHSLRARELTFTEHSTSRKTTKSFSWCKPWGTFRKNWIEPVFFIHGKYFERYFLFREYMEIVSQVYQAYQMSVYIPTRWVNDLFVMMIFLNCLSTPIIHWFVPRSNIPLRRLLSVVCSAFLNFVNSVVIPFIIFIPYPSQYDTSWGTFATKYLYDDVWYARAIRQNQQLFVTSYVDFCATWAPHWSQFSCLLACGDLVRRRRHHARRKAVVAMIHATANQQQAQSPRKGCSASSPRLSRSKSTLSHRKERIAYHGLWIIGAIILAIHIAAQSPGQALGCKLQSTPWFVQDTSCIVMNVNCYRRGIKGTKEELDAILSHVSPKSLFQLILAHCPKLQIPPSIRNFHELTGLDLYNSTLDEWRSEAALSETNHPKMIYMAIYLINMSGIPEGLLDHDFPHHLHSIDVYGTNLSTLPDNLREYWPLVSKVFLDMEQLDQFPSALAHMQNLIQISLVRNRITSIPDATTLFGNEKLQFLRLSDSALNSLPSEFNGSMSHFVKLDLEYTQLREIPVYVRDWYMSKLRSNEEVEHSLYGSPYCDVVLPVEDQEQRLYQSEVCSVDRKSAGPLFYFEVIKGQRLVETMDGI